ncbi:MAG: hypothetical protein HY716_17365 [Planctomycetes bacterium]|nr:hypothetical protein [Planctomycetota bacterium]
MEHTLNLTDAEFALFKDLLEQERKDLVTAIHHARPSSVREELRERQQMILQLLDKFHEPADRR